MKLTRGKDVTPKHDIAEDEEGVRALKKQPENLANHILSLMLV